MSAPRTVLRRARPARSRALLVRCTGLGVADDPDDGVTLLPADDTGFRIRFVRTQELKSGPNQMHLDLTSTSLEDQQQTVAKALALGAWHIDVGQ